MLHVKTQAFRGKWNHVQRCTGAHIHTHARMRLHACTHSGTCLQTLLQRKGQYPHFGSYFLKHFSLRAVKAFVNQILNVSLPLSSLLFSPLYFYLSFFLICPSSPYVLLFYPLLFLLSLFPRLSVPSVSLPRTRAHAFTGFFILWLCRFVQERGVARLSVTFFMVALISRCIVNYDFVSLTLTCIFPLRLFLMNRNSCLCFAREFTAAQPREASSRTPTSVGGRPDSAWVVVVVSGCQCPRIPRLLLVCGLRVCVCVREELSRGM